MGSRSMCGVFEGGGDGVEGDEDGDDLLQDEGLGVACVEFVFGGDDLEDD